MMKSNFLVAVLVVLVVSRLVYTTCPAPCSCSSTILGLDVNCSSRTNGYIPAVSSDTFSLDLSYNAITEIGVQLCKDPNKLEFLSFHNNLITELTDKDFKYCNQLLLISLFGNMIRSIEGHTFVNLIHLKYIFLAYNAIEYIHPDTFSNLPSLEDLDLSINNINHIKEHAFVNLPSLSILGLTGNPLDCGCNIFPFWSWLIKRSHIGTSAKCSNGTLVTSLLSTQLETCNPDNCQCFNGGKCVAMGNVFFCACIGSWTGKCCQESQCTSYDCGFGDCYIEPVNGTAQCSCDDRYVNYCPEQIRVTEDKAVENGSMNQQLNAACRGKQTVTIEYRDELRYVESTIKEVLRIAKPVVLAIYRTNPREIKVEKYTIPAESIILFDLNDPQIDPKLWDRPNEFDPDRWTTPQKNGYLPFGIGPRRCVGAPTVELSLFFMITNILNKFELIPEDERNLPMERDWTGISLFPKQFKMFMKPVEY